MAEGAFEITNVVSQKRRSAIFLWLRLLRQRWSVDRPETMEDHERRMMAKAREDEAAWKHGYPWPF